LTKQKIQLARVTTLVGYFGTLFFLMLWLIKIAPPNIPKSFALAIALLPLMLPLRGLLHGRVYTHSWASFLALPYFAYGVDAAVHRADQKWLGMVLVLLTVLWFFGCIYYSKHSKAYAAQNTSNENAA